MTIKAYGLNLSILITGIVFLKFYSYCIYMLHRNRSVTGKSSNSDIKLETEYFYFCLDCEVHTGKKDKCGHLIHPRIPLGIDITGTITSAN